MFPNLNGIAALPRGLQDKLNLFLAGDDGIFDRSPSTIAGSRKAVIEATVFDIASTYSIEMQKQAFKLVRKVFKEGVGFHSHDQIWAQLVEGNFDD